VAETRDIPNRPQQIADVLRRLRDLEADRERAELGRRLVGSELSDTERAELIHRQQALRELKARPLPPPPATG
jgi:hypothetical protein